MIKLQSLVLGLLLISAMAHADNARVVDSLAGAVRFKTVSHSAKVDNEYGEFRRFLSFLEARYPRTFGELQVEPVGEYSRLLRWQGRDPSLKPVLFDAHYDVVPVEPGTEDDWAYPAFSGAVEEGYVWGRGAIDDKGGLIAVLEGVEALLGESYVPNRTLLFSVVHDEEAGGSEGAVEVARKLLAEGTRLEFLVGEGGYVIRGGPLLGGGGQMAMIATGEKAFVTLILKATGEGGHSSRPPVDNALVRLAKAVAILHENPFEPELAPPASDMFEALARHTPGFRGMLLGNQWMFGGMIAKGLADDHNLAGMVRTTTAVTMFNSGVKENVVPQSAEAAVNFRLLPSMTPERLIEEVSDMIDDPRIEITISENVLAGELLPVSDKNGRGFKLIAEAIQSEAPGTVVVPGLLIATSDTRHYGRLTNDIYRFHTVTVQSDDSAVVHGTNERATIEGVEQSAKLAREIVRRAGLN